MKVGRSALETLGAAREDAKDSVGRLGSESTRPNGGCQEHAQSLTVICDSVDRKGSKANWVFIIRSGITNPCKLGNQCD